MEPMLVVFGAMIAAFAAVIVLAGLLRPRGGRRQTLDGSLRSDAADAEIEAVDIDQMIEARNERRRRAGRLEIGEELAREALRGPRER